MGLVTGAARDHLTLHGQMRRSKKINGCCWDIDVLPMSVIGQVRVLRVIHAFSRSHMCLKRDLMTACTALAKIKRSPRGQALPFAISTVFNDR